MRTAIYGAGSLGTVLGAYVTQKGYQIDLINRNRAHIAALKQNGATVTGTVQMNVKVNALLPEEMSGKYDVIFLMTKQLDNRAVVEFLAKFLTDDGVICTLQNGIPELSVADVIGEARTIGCTVAWGAELTSAGVCELTSAPDALSFGLGGFSTVRGEKFDEIVKLLECMGRVEIEENFIGARWAKLLVNSAFSGLSTALGCTFGEVCDNKTARLWAQKIIKECIDVTRASGVTIAPIQGKNVVKLLDYNDAFKQKISFLLIPIAMKKHRLLKASMLQDLQKGKPCEIDAINGVLSDSGKKINVPT
ncbi:MAG: 2-dehydropantoate 2-reductase, partial [Clostridiales bacterium]|nr:2-dehydropantoate 2-reductase [Clostridiales bacterium]